jgi:hypothetical protein
MTQQRQAPDASDGQADLQLEAELRRLRRDDQRDQLDWSAMQASITRAVAQLPAPQLPWWRRWSVMVPVTSVVVASVAAVVLWRAQAEVPSSPTPQELAALPRPDASPLMTEAPLVLDGEDFDVDSIDESALQQAFVDETAATADAVASDDNGDGDAVGAEPSNLVPSSLQWVDSLAADDLDQLDRWLDSQIVKKG